MNALNEMGYVVETTKAEKEIALYRERSDQGFLCTNQAQNATTVGGVPVSCL